MIALSAGLESLRTCRAHRWATCWKIDRTDGTQLRFTDHDTKLTVNSLEYTPIGGFRASARQKQAGLADQNLAIDGVLNSAAITYADLRALRYDGAEVTEFLVEWQYPWLGAYTSSRYWIREVTYDTSETWHAELDGITRWTRQEAGERLGADCPYTLGDPGTCGVDLGPLTATDIDVDTVTASRTGWETDDLSADLDTDDGYYEFGRLTWVTGSNAGLVSIVKVFVAVDGGNPAEFTLVNETPFDIVAGDTFDVEPGCDKQPFIGGDCNDKFTNMNHFGGAPTMAANRDFWAGFVHNLDLSTTNGDNGEVGKAIPYPMGPTAMCEGTVIYPGAVNQRIVPVFNQPARIELNGQLAVLFAGREIVRFLKIWADDRLIYEVRTISIVSTALQVINVTRQTISFSIVNGVLVRTVTTFTQMIVRDSTRLAGLNEIKVQEDATTSGFTNGANNGTFRVTRVTLTNSYHEIELDNKSAVTESAGASVTLSQTAPHWDLNDFNVVDLYLGTSTQGVDSTLLTDYRNRFGLTENAPAFRHRAYVSFRVFEYTKGFGNKVPRFKALVEESASKTIGAAITDVVARSTELSSADVDVTAVSGNLTGYTIGEPEQIDTSLRRLLLGYNLLVRESGGKLVFVPRTAPGTVTAPAADLAAHEFGGDAPRDMEFRDEPALQLSSEVIAVGLNGTTFLLQDRRHKRQEFVAESIRTLELAVDADVPWGLVLSGAELLAIAKRELAIEYANRREGTVQLPPSYFVLEEEDRLVATVEGETVTLLTRRVERGNNWLIRAVGVAEEAGALT